VSTEIRDVFAWEALDSRGNPTVGCEVVLTDGASGIAHVPSGASTGSHEALELRDGGARYRGRGVERAVAGIRGPLADVARGHDLDDLATLDLVLTGANDVGQVGANAVLGVSLAAALARARSRGCPLHVDQADEPARKALLPMPMVNIVSGGAHAGQSVDIQDVLVIPVGARTFRDAIEMAWRVRAGTAAVARDRGLESDLVADEGGLGPRLEDNRSAIELVCAGIERAGLRPGVDASLAIDVAATELHRDGRYTLAREGRSFTSTQFAALVSGWAAEFPIVSIEDPLDEDDWAGWTSLTGELGSMQVIGDDLFVTSRDRLDVGIASGAANAVLVKPNQTGNLTSAREVVRRAADVGYRTVLSARSGDTEDSWLADLAVGWRTGQIKVGSTTRSERTAKWNRLLYLESRLGEDAELAAFG
jgi:enolase